MSLDVLLQDVLDTVVDFYSAESVDLPERQLVSAGPPAWDCELLAVYLGGITPGNAGATIAEFDFESGAGIGLRSATIAVTIARCAATPKSVGQKIIPPTVAEEMAVATRLHDDAEMIDRAILESGLPSCMSLVPIGWTVTGPTGGFVAGEWRYRVGLDDVS